MHSFTLDSSVFSDLRKASRTYRFAESVEGCLVKALPFGSILGYWLAY